MPFIVLSLERPCSRKLALGHPEQKLLGTRRGQTRKTHLDQQLRHQGLTDDNDALVVAGHPGSCTVSIGQEDILPMVLQEFKSCRHNAHLILALVWRRD